MATIITPNGSTTILTDCSLASLQKAVGGYIEIIHLEDGRLLVIDEEGKLKGLTENPTATMLLHTAGGMPQDFVVGTVVLCESDEVE
jgi:hypothetical protein